ncbi:MAG: hypothetical protein WC575_02465 [Patescibacteria group bacterium]
MACFLAPTTAAIIVTIFKKKIAAKFNIKWLQIMLWGGVAWLIPEHIYHGEIIFYPPFFTAGFTEIISEVIRVGIPMVMATVTVWVIMTMFSVLFQKNKLRANSFYLFISGAVIMVLIDRIL